MVTVTSADHLFWTSRRHPHRFLLTIMWSIWVCVCLPGDTHILLWISLCENSVLSISNLFPRHSSANSSPFKFFFLDHVYSSLFHSFCYWYPPWHLDNLLLLLLCLIFLLFVQDIWQVLVDIFSLFIIWDISEHTTLDNIFFPDWESSLHSKFCARQGSIPINSSLLPYSMLFLVLLFTLLFNFSQKKLLSSGLGLFFPIGLAILFHIVVALLYSTPLSPLGRVLV